MRVSRMQSINLKKDFPRTEQKLSFNGNINIFPSVEKSVSPTLLDKIEAVLSQLRLDSFTSKYSVDIDLVPKMKGRRALKIIFSNDEEATSVIPFAYKRKPVRSEVDLPDENQLFQTVNKPLAKRKASNGDLYSIVSIEPQETRLGVIPVQEFSDDVFERTLNSEVLKCFQAFTSQEHSITIN